MSILFAIHLFITKKIISEMSESTTQSLASGSTCNKTDANPFKAPSILGRNFYQIIPMLKQFNRNTFSFQ